jgi:hypothetical protein
VDKWFDHLVCLYHLHCFYIFIGLCVSLNESIYQKGINYMEAPDCCNCCSCSSCAAPKRLTHLEIIENRNFWKQWYEKFPRAVAVPARQITKEEYDDSISLYEKFPFSLPNSTK